MSASSLDMISLVLGIIIGFVGYMIFNAFFNAAEYLKYEVYKKEKDFKEKRKEKKNEQDIRKIQ